MLLKAAFLILFTFHLSLFTSSAQCLPLIRNYTPAEYGGHNINFDVEIGEDGTVFVGNFDGLLYYDRAQWRIIHAPELRRATVVYRDSKNTFWVGGLDYLARLQKRNNGELYLQQVGQKGQFAGEVMEVFEEGASLQFVAGVESDVVSLEALRASDEDVILKDITQTEKLDGGLQVKVKRNGGLIIADSIGRELYTITEANGLCSNQVAYVAYDGHGVLWGATANGIFAIELPSIYSYFLPKDGLTGKVQTIAAFNGKIYVGDTNGLHVVDSWQYKRVADVSNICWALCESRDALLVATSSGIYRITADGRVSRLTSYATTSMFVDGDKVYAGEPDGVQLYKDEQGNLWFQNVNGETIGSVPTVADSSLFKLHSSFLKPLSDMKIRTHYLHGDHLWIGGDEKLAVIDMGQKDLVKLSESRRLRFCSIVMGSDSVLWGGYGDMPNKLYQLDSDEGHLHFFYALDYSPLTGQTLYRYRLNNKSLFSSGGRWSAWTDKQDVEFLNLPYGMFSLSVQAQLANGELSEIATVDFSIAYPLLMRWYMLVLYLIIFACMIYLLFRYRLKRLEKDKIKLERIVEERTADLRNAQHELIRQEKMATVGKLTKGLVDRILNPMNYIINYSKMSGDLLVDLKENIDHNKEQIDENDYADTQDVLGMLTRNLTSVHQFGQNTTRILKAMEDVLKDRTGGYGNIHLLPVLQQVEKQICTATLICSARPSSIFWTMLSMPW